MNAAVALKRAEDLGDVAVGFCRRRIGGPAPVGGGTRNQQCIRSIGADALGPVKDTQPVQGGLDGPVCDVGRLSRDCQRPLGCATRVFVGKRLRAPQIRTVR